MENILRKKNFLNPLGLRPDFIAETKWAIPSKQYRSISPARAANQITESAASGPHAKIAILSLCIVVQENLNPAHMQKSLGAMKAEHNTKRVTSFHKCGRDALCPCSQDFRERDFSVRFAVPAFWHWSQWRLCMQLRRANVSCALVLQLIVKFGGVEIRVFSTSKSLPLPLRGWAKQYVPQRNLDWRFEENQLVYWRQSYIWSRNWN